MIRTRKKADDWGIIDKYYDKYSGYYTTGVSDGVAGGKKINMCGRRGRSMTKGMTYNLAMFLAVVLGVTHSLTDRFRGCRIETCQKE